MNLGHRSPSAAGDALYAAGIWFLGRGKALDAATILRSMLLTLPEDERGWLGLGAAHEALAQPHVALELYAGGATSCTSVRCHIARARILRQMDRDADASEAIDRAASVLDSLSDTLDADEAMTLRELVSFERGDS